jgi:hypothetical protein
MAAHLRRLQRCDRCGKPATQELRNAANAPSGIYCDTHANKALIDWNADLERRTR